MALRGIKASTQSQNLYPTATLSINISILSIDLGTALVSDIHASFDAHVNAEKMTLVTVPNESFNFKKNKDVLVVYNKFENQTVNAT